MKYKTISLLFLTTFGASFFAFSENKQTVPFLGVYAVPVNPAVSKQLQLTDGLYLSLAQTIPDSPAAKAGLEQFDLLMKFDDQILVNPEQLQALVRSKKKGDLVKLSIMRGGKELAVEVELEEQQVSDIMVEPAMPVPVPDDLDPFGPDFPFGPDAQALGFDDLGGNLNLRFGFGDDVRDRIQRQLQRQRQQFDRVPAAPQLNDPELLDKYDADGDGKLSRIEQDNARADGVLPERNLNFGRGFGFGGIPEVNELLRDARRRGAASAWSSVSGAAQTKVMTMDETGSYEFSSNDGVKRFKVTSPDGEVLFDGPVNTKEERAKVPEDLRQRLDSIENNVKIRVNPARPGINLPQLPTLPQRPRREKGNQGKIDKNQLL